MLDVNFFGFLELQSCLYSSLMWVVICKKKKEKQINFFLKMSHCCLRINNLMQSREMEVGLNDDVGHRVGHQHSRF